MENTRIARLRRPGLAIALLTVVLVGLALAACSSASEAERGDGLPRYAYRSAGSLRAYQIAVRNQDLLAQLPCYCGCGQDPQFKNLRDCFISERGEFNSHAANCQVCIEEADDAVQWLGQGLSTKEIRERIDQKYEGRGKPTDTPPVTDDAGGA